MVGGGGDAQPSPPLDGGEFLLHLLKNPPQQPRNQPPPPPLPSQSLPHDPAVAVVGPSIPFPPSFPSNGHDASTFCYPPYAPHSYFNSQLGLGFPQNPNIIPNSNLANINPNHPNWPSSSPPGFSFMQSRPIYDQGLSDDLVKLALINQQQQQQQQQQEQHSKLVFGSLNSDVRSSQLLENRDDLAKIENFLLKESIMGMENRTRVNGLEADIHRTVEYNNRNQQFNSPGFYGSTMEASQQHVRQKPPPGFSGKPRAVGKKSLEQKVDKGKGYKAGMSSNGGVQMERLHLGDRSDGLAPSRGSNLHSVHGTEVEESMMALHAADDEGVRHSSNDGPDKGELDDLDEQVDSLGLEDGADEKSERRKHPKRDKDYRSDKRGQWLLNQRMRNYRRHIECRRDINRLNGPFIEIFESLMPPEEEKVKQKQLLALLDKHVTKEWPEARLFLYGSCANSFGFCRSDIDVCLAIGDADVNKSEILLRLADILQSDNLENVQALTRARVPIVKLMDPATGISCDICVNNLLAVINTKLLRDYSNIDVRLRQLAFIVKHWAKSRGVNETYQGTLSSYAYVLMCIHFLQQRHPSILPCLQEMEPTYTATVENVECSFFDQVEKLHGFGSRNGETIAQLVWAFFNYWAYCHDYANDVISVRTGSILSKRAKDWTRRIGNDRHLICIEDPFEVSHDLGRVVDKHSIRVLREEFERAADIMQNDPNPCIKLFEPYVPS